jgi:hypothetical protein
LIFGALLDTGVNAKLSGNLLSASIKSWVFMLLLEELEELEGEFW